MKLHRDDLPVRRLKRLDHAILSPRRHTQTGADIGDRLYVMRIGHYPRCAEDRAQATAARNLNFMLGGAAIAAVRVSAAV